MDWRYFLIIFSLCLTIIQADEHVNCVIEDHPKTRIFSTLEKYQANKRSFNPHDDTYEGNYVSFSFDSIDLIPKISFLTFTSEHVIGIDLSKKSIKRVDDGAFLYLFCLHHLDLSDNKISNLTTTMFMGLENLRSLNISGNSLTYLDERVFSNLKSIHVLNISYNNILELDKSALFDISSLEKLSLSGNSMKRIRYPYFSQLIYLRELYLDHNAIALMPTVIFSKNAFLETLDLSGNGLVLVDMRNDHSVLGSIKNLNLSDNYLITLHVNNIKYHFPNADLTIDLNNNQFYCSSWEQYLKQFQENHIKIVPGRNFSQEYYIDGISCDTLNKSLNANDTEEDTFTLNRKLGEDVRQHGDRFNNSVDYILHKLSNKEGELSGKLVKYKSVGEAPDKLPLVEHLDGTGANNIGEGTNKSDHHTIKGVTIGLAVIGAAFLVLITIDYVLAIGLTQRITRRFRRFWGSSSTEDNVEYVTLTLPS